jgi:hypothetical protein
VSASPENTPDWLLIAGLRQMFFVSPATVDPWRAAKKSPASSRVVNRSAGSANTRGVVIRVAHSGTDGAGWAPDIDRETSRTCIPLTHNGNPTTPLPESR